MTFLTISAIVCVLVLPTFGIGNQCTGPGVSLSVNPDANVKFTVILTLREPTSDNKCGTEWSDVALQTVAVIQWVIDRINSDSADFIQGVKLGRE